MLRPYVSPEFREPFTKSKRQTIRKYWSEYEKLNLSRKAHVYRARNPENLRKVQRYAGHPRGFSRFRVAFVPAPEGFDLRIRVGKSGSVTVRAIDPVSNDAIRRRVYRFSEFEAFPGETVKNPEAVAARILKADKGKSVQFARMCGDESEDTLIVAPELLGEYIGQFWRDYGNAGKWFFGVIGYAFQFQESRNAYFKARGIGLSSKKKRRRKGKPDRKGVR